MAWSAPLMKAKGEEPTPAPPTKFRCNRARMMLSIRVTLHHIAAAQINLTTTPTTIKLDTLKARRKFKLHRVYPRGVECDDTQTTAKMEGEMLVVEMPITKLPPIGEIEPAPAIPVQPAAKGARDAEQPAKKRKRGSDAGADDVAGSSAANAPKKPKKAAASESASGSGGAGSDSQGGAAPSNERMQQLLEDAARTADRRREQSLGKMHRFQQSEEEQNRKAAERQQEREQQKQKLLNTFRKQQAASRAEKHAEQKKNKARKASDATLASTPAASAPMKRVSFSSDAVESGKSR